VLEVVFVPGAAVGEVLPVEAGARLNHTIKLTEFFNILYFVNIDGGAVSWLRRFCCISTAKISKKAPGKVIPDIKNAANSLDGRRTATSLAA